MCGRQEGQAVLSHKIPFPCTPYAISIMITPRKSSSALLLLTYCKKFAQYWPVLWFNPSDFHENILAFVTSMVCSMALVQNASSVHTVVEIFIRNDADLNAGVLVNDLLLHRV